MDINKSLEKTRLLISTYNATSFLESFTMDIPTVIFWNPSYYELRDAAIPYFEDLKKVGIFHETPKLAAEHVGKIWDNVGQWWYSEPVRNILTKFKKTYCDLPDDFLCKLASTLKSIKV